MFSSGTASVPHRGAQALSCGHSVTFPGKYLPAAETDSMPPLEAVDDDTDFHGDGTGEEDKGDLFRKHLNAFLLQLTVSRESSMKEEGEDEEGGELVMISQLDAELQVAARQEMVEDVEDSDDENTNVLEVQPSSG